MTMMRRQCSTFVLLSCLLTAVPCMAFSVPTLQRVPFVQNTCTHHSRRQQQSNMFDSSTRFPTFPLRESDKDDRERVRVPRGPGRRRRYEDDDEIDERQERRYYDEEDYEYDDYDDEYNDEEDEFDFAFVDRVQVDEEYAADILIPNPILDNVDPEGAGERFGECARDPTFWRDVLIAIAVFNFCEYVAQVPYY